MDPRFMNVISTPSGVGLICTDCAELTEWPSVDDYPPLFEVVRTALRHVCKEPVDGVASDSGLPRVPDQ